jgi:hypothetical protein
MEGAEGYREGYRILDETGAYGCSDEADEVV